MHRTPRGGCELRDYLRLTWRPAASSAGSPPPLGCRKQRILDPCFTAQRAPAVPNQDMTRAADEAGPHEAGLHDLDLFGLKWDATSVVLDTWAVTPSAGTEAHGVDREDEDVGEGVDAKRQKRMQRNRESAAMSRERKKKHIDELEHKLAMLSSTVATLQAENHTLRSRRVGDLGVNTHPPEDLKQMTNTAALSMPPCAPVSFFAADLDASSLVLFAQELAGGCGISLPNSPAALFGAAGGGDDSVPLFLLSAAVCSTPAAQVACAG